MISVRRTAPTVKLTPRETEVVTWTAQGKTYSEIATILGISEDTAKAHIENVRLKLRATNKTHAIALALKKHLIQFD
jgi:LuxR family transcriptional activator of conjugal transfer of Ti plasmids